MSARRINDWALDGLLAADGGPVAVMFLSSDCLACLAPRAVFEAVASETLLMQFVEIDVHEHPGLVRRYGLRRVPTTVVFIDGVEVARQAGPDIAAMIRMIVDLPRQGV